MLRQGLSLVLLSLTLMPLTCSAGEILKWIDEEGRVHFGDRAPPGQDTEEVEVRPITYESPSLEALEEVLADRLSRPKKVVMYSATWCGVCKRAKAYFLRNGIDFAEYDIENSDKGQRDYKAMNGKGVPIILVGRTRLNGFSAEAFQQAFAR